MNAPKYPFPEFLIGRCTQEVYLRWLQRKATKHQKRDFKRGNTEATVAAYKVAIHHAVLASGGYDDYTGHPLDWELISTYDNDASKAGKRTYKQRLGNLPSADHVGDGLGAPDFRICAWRTNDAKNDLTYEEFVSLCRMVVEHHSRTAKASTGSTAA